MTAICKLFVDDGAYEGNDIFRYLSADNGILPCIKVRKNAKVQLKKGISLKTSSYSKEITCKKGWIAW
jgi:hypothetical protein